VEVQRGFVQFPIVFVYIFIIDYTYFCTIRLDKEYLQNTQLEWRRLESHPGAGDD
jgi:hypothetical protein